MVVTRRIGGNAAQRHGRAPARVRIRIESQQSVIRAKSEIDALKAQRRVPLEALMRNRQLDLQRRAIEKWDGHLPATIGPTPIARGAIDPHRD